MTARKSTATAKNVVTEDVRAIGDPRLDHRADADAFRLGLQQTTAANAPEEADDTPDKTASTDEQ